MYAQVVTISAGHDLATISFRGRDFKVRLVRSNSWFGRATNAFFIVIVSIHAFLKSTRLCVCRRCTYTNSGTEMNIAAPTNENRPAHWSRDIKRCPSFTNACTYMHMHVRTHTHTRTHTHMHIHAFLARTSKHVHAHAYNIISTQLFVNRTP